MPLSPEQLRTRVERASRRKVRLTLVAAVAVVVGGLIVLEAIVLGTLRPQLTELTRIGDDHARSVATTIHLRDHLGTLRRSLAEAVAQPSRPPVDVPGELRAMEASVVQLDGMSVVDAERTALAGVHEALVRVSIAAARAERERQAGRLERAREALRELMERSAALSRAADDLVRYNAGEVRDAAAVIHGSLERAMLASTVLAAVVMAGAFVVLRQELHALDAHEAMVERHGEELAAFASRAAHELRTPLHSIGLALHVLRRHPDQPAALERAEASARRLAQTIDDILRFSRAGGAPEPGASCGVGPVLDAVAAELGPRAADAGLELSTEAPPGLEVAMADGHLRTVLQNLVGNALKYGRTAGGRVTILAAAQGGRVVLSVADDGPGIPPHALGHVFEPFYRASTEAEGYGLGLPTVKRLVESHGGSITIDSAPGAGTTVTVALPRVAARQRGSAAARS